MSLISRIAGQAGYLFLNDKTHRTVICTWFHDRFVDMTNEAVTIVNTDFPSTSMEERMVRGPVETFVAKSCPQLVISLDNQITAMYQQLLDLCDRTRKGT